MKYFIKTGIIIFLTLAMFIGFTACNREEIQHGVPGSKVNVTGEITYTENITSEEERNATDAVIRAFENKYTGAKVNRDYSAGQIEARIASGDIGDVFHFPEIHTYTYAVTHKALMPLDAYLEPLGINLQEVYSGIYDLGVVNGRLYMAARSHGHIVLMVNTDALAREGLELPSLDWTWENFKKDYAPALTKQNADGTFSQVAMNLNLSFDPVFIAFMEGWGGKWYDTVNKKISLVSDPAVLEGITEMIKTADDGYLYQTQGDKSKYAGLGTHHSVFRSIVYSNMYALGTEYDTLGVNWDIATFPVLPTPKVGTGTSGCGVYNRTKRPDTAAAFALFFFTNEGQRAYHGQTGGSVPLTRALADDDFWHVKGTGWEDKNYDAFVAFPEHDTVGRILCRVPTPVANMIYGDPWNQMLKNHFTGIRDFKDSLTVMEARANQVWEKLIEDYYDH